MTLTYRDGVKVHEVAVDAVTLATEHCVDPEDVLVKIEVILTIRTKRGRLRRIIRKKELVRRRKPKGEK